MSATTTRQPLVRWTGIISLVAGIVMIVAGAVTWGAVTTQLADENITVSEDASFLPGDDVNGPFSAYAQAEIINEHALAGSDGKTYAELDQDDPVRTTMMTASFLRASLFTSVVAYGVAALVMGLGLLFTLGGLALGKIEKQLGAAPAAATGDKAALNA
ncbi:hypothetical protein [Paraoerskovia marina]|uniref:hypothetical protein n=1 Tax=Paraoerskovia marina TaxID=545619 RepID=UPI0004926858|nr:hypothetical protein [Paraoerskovia marina]